eukprot:1076451_1
MRVYARRWSNSGRCRSAAWPGIRVVVDQRDSRSLRMTMLAARLQRYRPTNWSSTVEPSISILPARKEKKNGGGRAGVPANQFTPSSTPGASSWNTSSAAGETKLFIRGLKWETSSETPRRAFEPYGAIKEAVVCQDRETRRSKGFGFVTFVSPAGAQAACQQPMKMIDGREIQCNFACDRRKPGDRAPGRAGPTGFTTSRGPPVQAMGMMAGAAQAAQLQQLQQLQMLQQQNQQLRLLEAQQVSAYQQPM